MASKGKNIIYEDHIRDEKREVPFWEKAYKEEYGEELKVDSDVTFRPKEGEEGFECNKKIFNSVNKSNKALETDNSVTDNVNKDIHRDNHFIVKEGKREKVEILSDDSRKERREKLNTVTSSPGIRNFLAEHASQESLTHLVTALLKYWLLSNDKLLISPDNPMVASSINYEQQGKNVAISIVNPLYGRDVKQSKEQKDPSSPVVVIEVQLLLKPKQDQSGKPWASFAFRGVRVIQYDNQFSDQLSKEAFSKFLDSDVEQAILKKLAENKPSPPTKTPEVITSATTALTTGITLSLTVGLGSVPLALLTIGSTLAAGFVGYGIAHLIKSGINPAMPKTTPVSSPRASTSIITQLSNFFSRKASPPSKSPTKTPTQKPK